MLIHAAHGSWHQLNVFLKHKSKENDSYYMSLVPCTDEVRFNRGPWISIPCRRILAQLSPARTAAWKASVRGRQSRGSTPS